MSADLRAERDEALKTADEIGGDVAEFVAANGLDPDEPRLSGDHILALVALCNEVAGNPLAATIKNPGRADRGEQREEDQDE